LPTQFILEKYNSRKVPKVKDIYQVQKKLTSKQESIIILIFNLASGPDQHQGPSFGPKVTYFENYMDTTRS